MIIFFKLKLYPSIFNRCTNSKRPTPKKCLPSPAGSYRVPLLARICDNYDGGWAGPGRECVWVNVKAERKKESQKGQRKNIFVCGSGGRQIPRAISPAQFAFAPMSRLYLYVPLSSQCYYPLYLHSAKRAATKELYMLEREEKGKGPPRRQSFRVICFEWRRDSARERS